MHGGRRGRGSRSVRSCAVGTGNGGLGGWGWGNGGRGPVSLSQEGESLGGSSKLENFRVFTFADASGAGRRG